MFEIPTAIFSNEALLCEDALTKIIEENANKNLLNEIKFSILQTAKKNQPQSEKKIIPTRRGPKTSKKAMQRKIKKLEELGFEKTLCEQALKAAFGNVSRATEYLLDGNIPSVDFSSASEIRMQTQKIVEENPVEKRLACEHIDRHEIESINACNFDISTVLQTYIACDRDIHVTQTCLYSMQ